MWRNFVCGEILDVKKFEMYRVKDDIIHTVLPYHGWYLCCFVAKSVQLQFTLLVTKPILSRFWTFYVEEIMPKILYVEKK